LLTFDNSGNSLVLTRAFFVNEIYMAFLLNSQAQGVSGRHEQSTQTPWRGAQYSCIGCIRLWSALCIGFSLRLFAPNMWVYSCTPGSWWIAHSTTC